MLDQVDEKLDVIVDDDEADQIQAKLEDGRDPPKKVSTRVWASNADTAF